MKSWFDRSGLAPILGKYTKYVHKIKKEITKALFIVL